MTLHQVSKQGFTRTYTSSEDPGDDEEIFGRQSWYDHIRLKKKTD